MRHLVRVKVSGLLGRFEHEVALDEDWEFVILHGPNGIGKTRFLEIVANALNMRISRLADLPFGAASFHFSDGSTLSVTKESQAALELDDHPADDPVERIVYQLSDPGGEIENWAVSASLSSKISSRLVRDLERYLPVEQVGPDTWVDSRSGEYVSMEEVVHRYGSALPFDVPTYDPPIRLSAFLDQQDVHLIETQRLLALADFQPRRAGSSKRHPPQRPTVVEFASDLARRIGEALATNSRTSQELDRTFPRRVLERNVEITVTDEEIRQRYAEQSDLRQRLAEISVLDPSREMEMPLSAKTLENWERRVLWTYLDDSERKLSTFTWLLSRVDLLREIINARFLFKEVIIDADSGFRFISDDGKEIGPLSLSSGEQHQIVLLYDLLFNVRQNSLVLVDEPEISLHVAWQQEFLNDIQQIAGLADLKFIVATHSPQVIHNWWERAYSLMPTAGGGNGRA